MVYQKEKINVPTPDIALAMGTYKLCDTALHERLRKFAQSLNTSPVSLEELRETLKKEMGNRSFSDEIRRLRDEE